MLKQSYYRGLRRIYRKHTCFLSSHLSVPVPIIVYLPYRNHRRLTISYFVDSLLILVLFRVSLFLFRALDSSQSSFQPCLWRLLSPSLCLPTSCLVFVSQHFSLLFTFRMHFAILHSPWWFYHTLSWKCSEFLLHFMTLTSELTDFKMDRNSWSSLELFSALLLSFVSQQDHPAWSPLYQFQEMLSMNWNSILCSLHFTLRTGAVHCICRIWNQPCQKSNDQSLYLQMNDLNKLKV